MPVGRIDAAVLYPWTWRRARASGNSTFADSDAWR
jgi:hypothetical protein